ncbi:MAG: DedA family protein [Alphaproteobacteria bacterium]|nr:DedA family protein [Alphaproteobacteria bacterium]
MDVAAYASLFLIAFAAATILPLQSELVVLGLLVAGQQPWPIIVAVASVGNVLGSIVNWILGRSLLRFQDKRWFPASRDSLLRAENWYRRFGRGTLLLSWVPIVGDPLTIIAGVLREPLWSFTLLVTLAKTGRYLALAAVALKWMA